MRTPEDATFLGAAGQLAPGEALRTVVLSRLFTDPLDPSFTTSGLLDTQRGKIGQLASILATEHPHPVRLIHEINQNNGEHGQETDLWGGLSDLMLAVEETTGDRFRYTPGEFVDSLRPYAEREVEKFSVYDRMKKPYAKLWQSLEVSEEQRRKLRTAVDTILQNPSFIASHSAAIFHPAREYDTEEGLLTVFGERRRAKATIAEDYVSGTGNTSILNGMMRTDDTCMRQSAEILAHHKPRYGDVSLIHGDGTTTHQYWHEVVFALPDHQTKEYLYDIQSRKDYSIISLEGMRDPVVPPLGDVTIVDPTVLQHFDNPFLEDLPYAQRIDFVKSIAPGSFTDAGVYVDSFINYVRFIGLLGVADPRFKLTKK